MCEVGLICIAASLSIGLQPASKVVYRISSVRRHPIQQDTMGSMFAAAEAYPISATIVAIAAGLVTIALTIREIFTPVGKRRPPPGKAWKLPHGPRGVPILGNLLLLRRARDDQDFKMVRGHHIHQYQTEEAADRIHYSTTTSPNTAR